MTPRFHFPFKAWIAGGRVPDAPRAERGGYTGLWGAVFGLTVMPAIVLGWKPWWPVAAAGLMVALYAWPQGAHRMVEFVLGRSLRFPLGWYILATALVAGVVFDVAKRT